MSGVLGLFMVANHFFLSGFCRGTSTFTELRRIIRLSKFCFIVKAVSIVV